SGTPRDKGASSFILRRTRRRKKKPLAEQGSPAVACQSDPSSSTSGAWSGPIITSPPEEGAIMTIPVEYDYTVLLVFPGFDDEGDNAELIVEAALEWLNTYKEEPGFRFAPYVGAHLEIVPDIDEVRDRIEAGDSVAMVLLHDVPEDERNDLIRDCETRAIAAC